MINTVKVLKELSRMPYGVRPTSGIFHRFIENALKGISFTGVQIDDIIVSGVNAKNHLRNLDLVLDVLERMGAIVNKENVITLDLLSRNMEYVV